MLWPVFTAKSTIFFMSLNSPTPKLSSVRSANTGTATPAPLHGRVGKRGCKSARTILVPVGGTSAKKWLGPSSHRRISLVFVSTMTNLYSTGSWMFRDTDHQGKRASVRRVTLFQLPRTLPVPTIPTDSSLRTSGAVRAKVTLPSLRDSLRMLRNDAPSGLRKMTSLNAEL